MEESNVSILVVAETSSLRGALCNILDDEGYRVFTADSGLEGLRKIQTTNFSVVLLDEFLPDIGGVELLEKIKRTDCEVDLILMISTSTLESVVKATKLGVADILEKPLSLDTLLESMQRAIRAKKPGIEYRGQTGEMRLPAFFNTICIYPDKKDRLEYLTALFDERFFRFQIAKTWIDIIALPAFIYIIDPREVKREEWSILFDYLSQVGETWERYVLTSTEYNSNVPEALTKFFKTIQNSGEIEKYILYRNKRARRWMSKKDKSNFVNLRRREVRRRKELLVRELARYFNVSTVTIGRDLSEISQRGH